MEGVVKDHLLDNNNSVSSRKRMKKQSKCNITMIEKEGKKERSKRRTKLRSEELERM